MFREVLGSHYIPDQSCKAHIDEQNLVLPSSCLSDWGEIIIQGQWDKHTPPEVRQISCGLMLQAEVFSILPLLVI